MTPRVIYTLTPTVGAGLAPARKTARVTNHVTAHVDACRATARVAPTVDIIIRSKKQNELP